MKLGGLSDVDQCVIGNHSGQLFGAQLKWNYSQNLSGVYSVAELVDTAVRELEKPDCPEVIEFYYKKPLPEAWGSEVPCNIP